MSLKYHNQVAENIEADDVLNIIGAHLGEYFNCFKNLLILAFKKKK